MIVKHVEEWRCGIINYTTTIGHRVDYGRQRKNWGVVERRDKRGGGAGM